MWRQLSRKTFFSCSAICVVKLAVSKGNERRFGDLAFHSLANDTLQARFACLQWRSFEKLLATGIFFVWPPAFWNLCLKAACYPCASIFYVCRRACWTKPFATVSRWSHLLVPENAARPCSNEGTRTIVCNSTHRCRYSISACVLHVFQIVVKPQSVMFDFRWLLRSEASFVIVFHWHLAELHSSQSVHVAEQPHWQHRRRPTRSRNMLQLCLRGTIIYLP